MARRAVADEEFTGFVIGAAVVLPPVLDRNATETVDLASGGTGDGSTTLAPEATFVPPNTSTTYLQLQGAMTIPPPSTIPPATLPPPTTAPDTTPSSLPGTTVPVPTTLAAPGAPEVVGASGDATTGRVTIRFSIPVAYGTSPATSCCPADYLAAMSLVVYGADPTCAIPAGNAHEYLSGAGTTTITTDATSLVAGTTYITVGSGFVTNARDGTPNATAACIGVQVS